MSPAQIRGSETTPMQSAGFQHLVDQCIHCGLCLPVCPTYAETARERNSPRGRLLLMRAVAEEQLALSTAFADEMDYCLGCLACTSACPAGVNFGALLEASRVASEKVRRGMVRGFVRWLTMRYLFVRQARLQQAARLLRWYQRSRYARPIRRAATLVLSRKWAALERSAPKINAAFSDALIAETEKPSKPRYRVLLLTGCVQDIAFSEVNRATADVLLANGCEVFTPRLQGCCGSLHAHNGDLATAQKLARAQLDRVDLATVDAIISNAAGCGSHLKHFGALLADDPKYTERAAEWDRKVFDVSEFLVRIGFRRPVAPTAVMTQKVTYHDACHLCHGQGVVRQPREILGAIPGLELHECAEANWCCGSAGTYALTHPETASRLRERKWKNLDATGAEIVALGNPGCALHLSARDDGRGPPQIVHPVVLLAQAYAREAG